MRASSELTLVLILTNNIRYDGAATGPAYEPHEFVGLLPTADVENPTILTGRCHCGSVSVAVKAKPLPSKGQTLPEIRGPGSPFSQHMEYIQECNCSICMRVCIRLLHRNSAFHIFLVSLLPCCNLRAPPSCFYLTLYWFRMALSSCILSALKCPFQTRVTASERT